MQLNANILTCHNTLRFAVTHPKAKVWALIWGVSVVCTHVQKTLTIRGLLLFLTLSRLHSVCFLSSRLWCNKRIIEDSKTLFFRQFTAVEKCFFYIPGLWGPRWAAQKVVKHEGRCPVSPLPLSLSVLQGRKDGKMVLKHHFWPVSEFPGL